MHFKLWHLLKSLPKYGHVGTDCLIDIDADVVAPNLLCQLAGPLPRLLGGVCSTHVAGGEKSSETEDKRSSSLKLNR